MLEIRLYTQCDVDILPYSTFPVVIEHVGGKFHELVYALFPV